MQCEGITRSGQRCRNKALADEIFCATHLRVNRTYSLALLVPFLTILALTYFFLFGLAFDTLVYGVFDISYLKFAGLSDLFASMVRTGALLTVILLKSWTIFALVLALGVALALIVKLCLLTTRRHLAFGRKMRIIGFSLAIYVLNLLHMFTLLLPRRVPGKPANILIGREHLARSLRSERERILAPLSRTSRDIISEHYQCFLTLTTFRNHHFFVLTAAFFLISALAVLYAGYQARDIRDCAVHAAENANLQVLDRSNLPGMTLSGLCLNGPPPASRKTDVWKKFLHSLHSFFEFPGILLVSGGKTVPLIYVGSTDRFELFFNGVTGRPLILPSSNMGDMFGRTVSAPSPAENALLQAVSLQSRKLELMRKDVQSLLVGEEHAVQATIPSSCWAAAPLAVLEFRSGSAEVTEAAGKDLLAALSRRFQETGSRRILISGFTDPSGPPGLNLRLSLLRAEAAGEALVAQGLAPRYVTAVGLGEDSRVHPSQRRVEIRDCTGIF